MTVPEFAVRMGVGRNSAYDAVNRGQVPSIRIGRRLLIPVAAVDALLMTGNFREG